MSNAFIRGLKILFGIKPLRRVAPRGSLIRPKLFVEGSGPTSSIEEVFLKKPLVKKREIKKKVVRKKSVKKNSVKKSSLKKRVTKKKK